MGDFVGFEEGEGERFRGAAVVFGLCGQCVRVLGEMG